MLKSQDDAFKLLKQLGAQQRLFKHLELVGEAGGEVTSKLDALGVQYNKLFDCRGMDRKPRGSSCTARRA